MFTPHSVSIVTASFPMDTHIRNAAMTLPEFAERIVEHYRAKGTVRDTLKLIRRVLLILERDVGVKSVAELERDEIGDIIARFDAVNAGFSSHTKANRSRMLFAIIRTGYELGLLRTCPRLPKTPQIDELPKGIRSKPPAPEDVHRLMLHLAEDKSWRGRRLHTLVSIVLLAKIPVTIAVRLRVADIDLVGRTIRYRARYRGRPVESAPSRTVRIDDDLAKIIEAWIPLAKSEWLIPGERRQGYWSRLGGVVWTPLGRLKAACEAADIPAISFEALRRFHAERASAHLPYATMAARVILGKQCDAPIVNGKPVPLLTPSQFNVIKALWAGAPGTLSGQELIDKSGHTDAVAILKRLSHSDNDWAAVIVLGGKRGAGYGLLV